MASRKFFNSRSNYIYPLTSDYDTTSVDNPLEFDESDVWTIGSDNNPSPSPTESKKTKPIFRQSKKILAGGKKVALPEPASFPVSIPDWPAILKDEYRRMDGDVAGGDSEGSGVVDDRIPPHEYLARTRGASLSVHEGVGRTLKGRDLRRVRNTIWKKFGFED